MTSYKEILTYLESFVNYENSGFDGLKNDFRLDKLFEVLKKAGDPHCNYRSIHIGGTKGKGSVCSFVSSVLKEAGYKVGLFTSPHLITARERIKVDDQLISEYDFVKTFNYLREYLGSRAEERFTFFEIYTLIALLHFSIKKVDFAVIEVGMGGRLDATNVVDAEICGICPVSYDHTQFLGSTLHSIAREKAGIIKEKAYCVSSPQYDPVIKVLEEQCSKQNASLTFVGKDLKYSINNRHEKGSCFDLYGKMGHYADCRINMPGDFQISNCATAAGICERVFTGREDWEDIFKKGIERAFVPGRMESLCENPHILIDGAQNADSAMHLKYSVEQVFKYDKLILLLGVCRDKDIKGVCYHLSPLADEIILTRASVERAADPYLIKGYIRNRRARITDNIEEALGMAFSIAGKNDIILATGSFFVIAEVRKIVLGKSVS